MFKKLIALTGITLLSLNTAQAQINSDPGSVTTGTLPGTAGQFLSFNPDNCVVSWNGRYPFEKTCPYENQYVDPVCLNDCKYRWGVNIGLAQSSAAAYCQAQKDKADAEAALAAAQAVEQEKLGQLMAIREAIHTTSESIRYYEGLYEQVEAAYDQYYWDCFFGLGSDACELKDRMAALLVDIEATLANLEAAKATQDYAYSVAWDAWREAESDVWSAENAVDSATASMNAALRNLNSRIRAGMNEWTYCTRDCPCLEDDN